MKTVHNDNATEDTGIKQELVFGLFYRLHHWIRVVSIVALVITGFYIANPFIIPAVNSEPTNFMQALFRSWHVIFGFVVIAMFIAKLYYFFFVKSDEGEMASVKDLFSLKKWYKQIGYYMFLTPRPEKSGVYNTIQFAVYFLFYIILFMLILTGLILYVHVYHQGLGGFLYGIMRPFEVMLGGLASVRNLHHLLMWGVIIFILIHVYLAVFNAVYQKRGNIDSIFSGYKWRKYRK